MRRAALCLLALAALLPASAGAETIRFRGEQVAVPAGWPVVRLAERPHACVRLDRKAVYLGTPGPAQRCPAGAMGRRRAILVDPGARVRAEAQASRAPQAHLSGASDYTGLGFDACTAPSRRSMSAWADSPYRALGVYVGGLNRGCSQPNLTASWVAEQTAAGWSLIPTYVGLQAPTSSCTSCATLSSSTATAATQGTEAADDAVEAASLAGIGVGSPIYFDMESYSRTSSATNATLTFLAAWTNRLHALGYSSGVYSSSASGIADLASRLGTSYPQPDDIWVANWDGRANATGSYFPAGAWTDHQRIHQYRGGHDETYGGVTINIDNNYVEGATAGGEATEAALPALSLLGVRPATTTVRVRVRCGWPSGETCPGQILLRSHVRLNVGSAGRTEARVVRVAVARRAFRLAGGRAHTFTVALNARGRPLLAQRGSLKAHLLVAIPGSRVGRELRLR
jgi:hypothetical protein